MIPVGAGCLLVPAPTGLPGPAAVSSASSSQPGRSPWLLRYQTPRVPKPARYHRLDRLPCPLRRRQCALCKGRGPITLREQGIMPPSCRSTDSGRGRSPEVPETRQPGKTLP